MLCLLTNTVTMNSLLYHAYTKGLGYIFLVAFLSYYAQYPALSSSQGGIDPPGPTSDFVFRRVVGGASAYALVEKGYIDVDGLVELINLLGAAISMVIASGIAQHAILYLIVTSIYYFLVLLGGQFYTFQWDILLVETGFLTAFCFAPWRWHSSFKLNKNEVEGGTIIPSSVGCWPLRFLLFKLMFMSGIVKIQSQCPTWQNLTALEYHFATQCLPGPLAWYAHQLPPLILRLGVAATFVIEIPATIFLLIPSTRVRRFGSWMQILLQLLIIATGNYNFFNLLTILLCFPCMMGVSGEITTRKSSDSNTRRSWFQRNLGAIQAAMCAIVLAMSCRTMFRVERHITEEGKLMIGLKLSMNKYDCNNLVKNVVPIIVLFTMFCTFLSGLLVVRSDITICSRLSSFMRTLVCLVCIVVTAIPILDLAPSMHQIGFVNQSMLGTVRRHTSVVSHGYGLFRRMTGVGKTATFTGISALDLPPSIVARPEIVFEAIIVDENGSGNSTSGQNVWQELNFRWKPGAIDRRPLQVAPHQPRFQWRMWFAALTSIQQNPWLVSFAAKILAGCPSVISLLDEPELLAKKKKIKMIRAQLYEYDFTRLDTIWARRIPDVQLVADDGGGGGPWWKRKLVRDYFPALDLDNESLKRFLQQAGYSLCRRDEERCNDSGYSGYVCHFAYFLRRLFTGNPLSLSIIAILACALVDLTQNRTKRKPKIKRE